MEGLKTIGAVIGLLATIFTGVTTILTAMNNWKLPEFAGEWLQTLVTPHSGTLGTDPTWFYNGIESDWTGTDLASTKGIEPKYAVSGQILCDAAHEGFFAMCFTNRTTGYPPNVATDILSTEKPSEWCVYRTKTTSAKPDGILGSIYRCARPILKKSPL